jgi:hypothetical protein
MGGSSKAPPPPDYEKLAVQQAGLNKEAFEYQTKANRVNQTNSTGSSTWSQDPTTGQWNQSQQYSPEYQKIIDAQRGNTQSLTDTASGMLGGIKDAYSQPFDTSGMTNVQGWQGSAAPDTSKMENWGKIDYSDNPALADSGFGGVESVQKAMMSRLQPALDQGNAAEIARLKSQGITEGSPAWQAAMQSQGQKANDANQQALLGSMGAYGDIFNRSLQARQQSVGEEAQAANYANALRGQQLGEGTTMFNIGNQAEALQRGADEADRTRQMQEALMQRQLPLQEYQQLMGAAGGVPGMQFGNFFNQGNAGAADITGGAQQTYQAQMDAYNASQKAKAGMLGGVGSVAGGIIGGVASMGNPAGVMAGAAAGSAIGGGVGGAAGSYYYR